MYKEYEKFGLTEREIDELKRILLPKEKIEKIILFGSRARGNYTRISDIDIALKGSCLNSTDINLLRDEFEESRIIYKVDLIHYEKITNNDFKNNIDKDGIEILK